jgi:catechol 2,3-dioxygenase-like lactoylglutathione lyase family enzyme
MSPIVDLAGLTLEVTNLERAAVFYTGLLGLELIAKDDEAGTLELRFGNGQHLRCWMPITKQVSDPRLAKLGARGGSHVHFAMQIPVGTREAAKAALDAHGVHWTEIDLGDEEFHDYGLYFFDPFGHGLELREVVTDPRDPRAPVIAPAAPSSEPHTLPIIGLREVALAFTDFEAMLDRLPIQYGLGLHNRLSERNFAQFTLAAEGEEDGKHTPRRWLYAWDPQVGLAEMLGGEHALVSFYADLEAVTAQVVKAELPHMRDAHGLAVRDPSGHVFEFLELT